MEPSRRERHEYDRCGRSLLVGGGPPRQRRLQACASGSGSIGAGQHFGDIDGDCDFDIYDVTRWVTIYNEAGNGAVPTAFGGGALSAWIQQQLDASDDGQLGPQLPWPRP